MVKQIAVMCRDEHGQYYGAIYMVPQGREEARIKASEHTDEPAVQEALYMEFPGRKKAEEWIAAHPLSNNMSWSDFCASRLLAARDDDEEENEQPTFYSAEQPAPVQSNPMQSKQSGLPTEAAAATSTRVQLPVLPPVPEQQLSNDPSHDADLRSMLKTMMQRSEEATLEAARSRVENSAQFTEAFRRIDMLSSGGAVESRQSPPAEPRGAEREAEMARRLQREIAEEREEAQAVAARGLIEERRKAAGISNGNSSSSNSHSGFSGSNFGSSVRSSSGVLNPVESPSHSIPSSPERLSATAGESKVEAARRRALELESAASKEPGSHGAVLDTQQEHPYDGTELKVQRALATRRSWKAFDDLNIEEALEQARTTDGFLVPLLDGSLYSYKVSTQIELQAQKTKRTVHHTGVNPYVTTKRVNPDEARAVKYGPLMTGEKPSPAMPITFSLLRQLLRRSIFDCNDGNSLLDAGDRMVLPKDVSERAVLFQEYAETIGDIMAKYDSLTQPIAENKNKIVIQVLVALFFLRTMAFMTLSPADMVFDLRYGTDDLKRRWSETGGRTIAELSDCTESRRKTLFMHAAQFTNMCCPKCDQLGSTLETCGNMECKTLREGGDMADKAATRKAAVDLHEAWKKEHGLSGPAASEEKFAEYMRRDGNKNRGWRFPPKPTASTAASMDPFTRYYARQDLVPDPVVEETEKRRFF
jgi:hypothetical protein